MQSQNNAQYIALRHTEKQYIVSRLYNVLEKN